MEFSEREGGGDYAVDDDEVKMEEFFAILRSFRHAFGNRKRLEEESISGDGEGGRPAKRRKVAAAAERTSWVPKFEWEDFNTVVEFRGAVSEDSAPVVLKNMDNTKEEEDNNKCKIEEVVKDHEEDGNLPLKLTLSL